MAKIIFYLLIIAGLCFSQSIESAYDADVSLMRSRSIYLKPMAQMNYQVDEMAFNNAYYNPIPNAFALLTQVEGETLQPKRSFWKQAGIYGLEFVGGGVIGTPISYYAAFIAEGGGDLDQPHNAILGYTVGQILFTSSGTWITAKLLGQKGSWRKAVLGTASGCLIGFPSAFLVAKMYPEGFMNGIAFGIFLITPPLGAVVGFNIK